MKDLSSPNLYDTAYGRLITIKLQEHGLAEQQKSLR
jgi:hypothetical protein